MGTVVFVGQKEYSSQEEFAADAPLHLAANSPYAWQPGVRVRVGGGCWVEPHARGHGLALALVAEGCTLALCFGCATRTALPPLSSAR